MTEYRKTKISFMYFEDVAYDVIGYMNNHFRLMSVGPSLCVYICTSGFSRLYVLVTCVHLVLLLSHNAYCLKWKNGQVVLTTLEETKIYSLQLGAFTGIHGGLCNPKGCWNSRMS